MVFFFYKKRIAKNKKKIEYLKRYFYFLYLARIALIVRQGVRLRRVPESRNCFLNRRIEG